MTTVNWKRLSKAQVATVKTSWHLDNLQNSACSVTFVYGRLLNIYLTKNFPRAKKSENLSLR